MTPRLRAGARLAAWLVLLVLALAGLHAIGGSLSPPPLLAPTRLAGWAQQRQPAEVVLAGVRLLALGLGWYLLVVTMGGMAARLFELQPLVRAFDLVSIGLVRRMVGGVVGFSLTTAALTSTPATAGTAAEPPPIETMRRLPDAEPPAPSSPPPTMRRLSDEPGAPPPPTPPRPDEPRPVPPTPPSTSPPTTATTAPPVRSATPPTISPAPPSAPSPAPNAGAEQEAPLGQPAQAPPAAPASWTVRPGDHFWAAAERSLAQAWNRPPTDAETAPYWRSLVAANRDRLRDPANPDLIFPGQVLVVPPPPPPST